MGLALGGGIGLIGEISDTSIHTSAALQAALGIPVLVAVPKIMLEPDRLARSRRILRESLAAVGVVVFVLLSGVATYYLVNGVRTQPTQIETEEARGNATEARFDFGSRRG
jgi:hypothetical protein